MELGDNLTAVLIVIACVIGPIWVIKHYKAKTEAAGRLSAEDAQALAQMAQTAQALENRVAALERILDAEVPAWREGAR